MWNVKSGTLFIVSLIVVIMISMKMASAEEKKTVTPKEFATKIVEVPSKVGNHLKNEWEETKAFQANAWAEAKKKWPWNKIFKGNQ